MDTTRTQQKALDDELVAPENHKEENQEDDDNVMGGEQEDEEDEELYGDLNLNMDKRDDEMTDAQTNQETKEVHVTLTTEPPIVQQQSSSVLSDLVSKFINPSPNTGIDSILNPNVQSDIPVNVSVSATTKAPSSNTTIPQPPILIIQPQQQTHNPTTTTPIPTITLPEILNFASLFSKDLFALHGDVVTLKRGRDDQDKDEEPSDGLSRGTKQKRLGKEESSKEETQKESKFTSSSKGASRS
ncbi:hypothetical protein Tco_1138906 [Tanacetum coccineum]